MGCCSSTERDSRSPSAQQPETVASPSTSDNRLAAGTTYSNNNVSNSLYSPSSSRAPLTGPEPTSARSSPRQSTNAHRQHSSEIPPVNRDPALSAHYNIPLQTPKSWSSTKKIWTKKSAAKERQDFFDTRVAGRREVWEALRQIAECLRENDLNTAQVILDAAGITLPTGRLEDGCYDERGELYKIPHIIVKDPDNLQLAGEGDDATVVGELTKSKGEDLDDHKLIEGSLGKEIAVSDDLSQDKGKSIVDENAVSIRCRWSHTGLDTIVSLDATQQASVLFVQLRKQQNDKGKSSRLRIFYLGRELKEKEKKTLEDFGWREGHVLNIFVVGAPT